MPRPFLQVLRGDQVPLARGLRGLALVLFALLLVGPGFGGGASGPWNTSFAGGPSAARVGASPGGEAAQTGRLLWQNVTFPPGHLPPARCCGAMAYDAFTQEMVEFGGIGVCGGCNDTYVLSAGRWLDLPASQNTAPPSRSWSSMAYDPALQEIVLFGGESYAGQPLGDTWTFNATVWSQLAPAQAPAPRWSAGLAWDGQDGALLLFGGFSPRAGFLGDTWELVGGQWQPVEGSVAPSPRWGASMADDPADGQVVLFGGYTPSHGFLGDTWAFVNGSWSLLAPAVAPPPREKAVMAFDPAVGSVVLFGGDRCPSGCVGANPYVFLNDTWLFVNGSWQNATNPADAPPARCCSQLAFNGARGILMLFSGHSNAPYYVPDAWFLAPSVPSLTPVGLWAVPQPVPLGDGVTLTVGVEGLRSPPSYDYTELPPGCSGANVSTLYCVPGARGSFPVSVTVTDLGTGAQVTINATVQVSSAGPLPFPAIPGGAVASAAVGGVLLVVPLLLAVREARLRRGPPSHA